VVAFDIFVSFEAYMWGRSGGACAEVESSADDVDVAFAEYDEELLNIAGDDVDDVVIIVDETVWT
jgi:hypothetical protein